MADYATLIRPTRYALNKGKRKVYTRNDSAWIGVGVGM
jgi:hypothetical protein